MQAAQDITVGARLSKTQYQYALVDVDSDELNHWAPILLQKMQGLPQLADVASDQQSAGPTLKVEINRTSLPVWESIPPMSMRFFTTLSASATWPGFTRP
jgi:multidrug efflux pump subunit AcrB